MVVSRYSAELSNVFRQMEKFVRGLGSFATACREDLSGFKFKEQFLDLSFKDLQESVKLSIRCAQKPKPADPGNSAMKSRYKLHPDERPLPLPPLQKRPPRESNSIHLEPVPFPVRHYAMRAQPCQAASRIYRPKARERLQEDRLEMIDEYIKFPNPEGALELDGGVDPVLRVGTFQPDEMKWNGRIPTNAL